MISWHTDCYIAYIGMLDCHAEYYIANIMIYSHSQSYIEYTGMICSHTEYFTACMGMITLTPNIIQRKSV